MDPLKKAAVNPEVMEWHSNNRKQAFCIEIIKCCDDHLLVYLDLNVMPCNNMAQPFNNMSKGLIVDRIEKIAQTCEKISQTFKNCPNL